MLTNIRQMSEKARAFAESDEEEEGKEGDQKLSKGKLRKANRLSVARMFMVCVGGSCLFVVLIPLG